MLEPSKEQAESERKVQVLKYYAHFAKMYHLNLAVFGLVKIQDLVVRLLFENFGGALIAVDLTDDDWEKALTLKEAKKGLKERLDAGDLLQSEYESIVSALEVPSESKHRDKVIEYRNGIVHRIRPSVDYPELFTEMEDRIGEPIYDAIGKEKARLFGMRAKPSATPKFYFADLHTALLDYLKHVIEMLTQLKRIPRLA